MGQQEKLLSLVQSRSELDNSLAYTEIPRPGCVFHLVHHSVWAYTLGSLE
jgi:hypothetical protein